jgi:hypothetical protein
VPSAARTVTLRLGGNASGKRSMVPPRVDARALITAPPSNAAPMPLSGCGEFNPQSKTNGANRPNKRDEFQHDRPTKTASTGGCRIGCETLTLVCPMSRRELLTATASVVGGGLAVACAPRVSSLPLHSTMANTPPAHRSSSRAAMTPCPGYSPMGSRSS